MKSRMAGASLLLCAALAAAASPPAETVAVLNNRGLAHLISGRVEDAVKAFQKAAEAAPPGVAEPWLNLALSLERARRPGEALAALQKATGLPRAAVVRARLLRAAGREAEAFAAWEEARKAGILDTPSLWHLLRLQKQLRRPAAESLPVLDDLARQAPEPGALDVERAEILSELGRVEEALAAARRAASGLGLERDAELASLLQEAGAADKAGQGEEARVTLSMAGNLLRSTETYTAAAARLARFSPDSAISEEPLPVPGAPEPGKPPGPLVSAGEARVAAGARGICAGAEGFWVVGEAGAVPYTRTPEGGWRAGREVAGAYLDCLAADFDQDGLRDLALAGREALVVAWAADGAPPGRWPGTATALTAFDADRDGDTDLLAAGPGGLRLWQNGRDRTFQDASRAAGLEQAAGAAAAGALATDLDADGSPEILVERTAAPSLLLAGVQEEKVRPLPLAETRGAATLADCDHDGDLDLLAAGLLLLNDGLGGLAPRALPATAGAARLGGADLDQDGFPDLLALGTDGRLKVLRATGACAFLPWEGAPQEGLSDAAVADFDGDGRLEIAALSGEHVRFLRSPAAGTSIRLALLGTKDNTDGLDAKIDLWAGRLRLRQEMRAGTAEIGEEGPSRLLGLADRGTAEWLRVSWPNATWEGHEEVAAGPLALEQSRDLAASCPFLYAWDGERFAFATDLLGGAPLGLPVARGVRMPTDPDEYYLLPEGLAAAAGGRYELRITEELREIAYLDRVELLAVDRPAGAVVATDDGLRLPPFPPFHLYASASPRPPRAAADHHGADVRDRLLRIDGRYPDDFRWIGYQGYAEPSALTLDFDALPDPGRGFLVVTGGYYWSEADNLAISQSQTVQPRLPRLEVWRQDRWETVLDPMPFPGGRVKTLAVPLAGLPPGPVRLRISSNLRLYFDRILLATEDLPASALRVERLQPLAAELGWHGYSAPGPFDGMVPRPFVYERASDEGPFPRFEGFFTRYGDVLPLVTKTDNGSALLHHGDEVRLSFPAPPPPPAGWVRELLLYTVGWDKDAHPNTAAGITVEPLPFTGMKSYPYRAPERFPWTPELLDLQRTYQTRWIPRSIP